MTDFGAPVKSELPPTTNAGGRKSMKPALRAWLTQVKVGDGSYELASKDEDKAHPVGRGQALREVAKEMNAEEGATVHYAIDSRAVTPGKRYRFWATATAVTPAKTTAKK